VKVVIHSRKGSVLKEVLCRFLLLKNDHMSDVQLWSV
jgi:hypothetical protein